LIRCDAPKHGNENVGGLLGGWLGQKGEVLLGGWAQADRCQGRQFAGI